MAKIISVHEYLLKPGISAKQFEEAINKARKEGLLKLPGLSNFHFLKGIRGVRKGKYTAIWIYESLIDWEKLWGPINRPKLKQDYPENWKIWENEVLTPFLISDPDKITFTSYQEF